MSRAEYMRIHSKYFPQDTKDRYKIKGLIAADVYVYIKIIKGLYGLNQADIISYNQIILQTEPYVSYPVPFKTGLWAHNTRKTKFCSCVDDFGVKYSSKDDANHLLNSLKNHFAI